MKTQFISLHGKDGLGNGATEGGDEGGAERAGDLPWSFPPLWVLVPPPPFPPNLHPFACHSSERTRSKLTQLTNIWKELALCSPHNKAVTYTYTPSWYKNFVVQNTEVSFNLIRSLN